jgi:hypothetical protein
MVLLRVSVKGLRAKKDFTGRTSRQAAERKVSYRSLGFTAVMKL